MQKSLSSSSNHHHSLLDSWKTKNTSYWSSSCSRIWGVPGVPSSFLLWGLGFTSSRKWDGDANLSYKCEQGFGDGNWGLGFLCLKLGLGFWYLKLGIWWLGMYCQHGFIPFAVCHPRGLIIVGPTPRLTAVSWNLTVCLVLYHFHFQRPVLPHPN